MRKNFTCIFLILGSYVSLFSSDLIQDLTNQLQHLEQGQSLKMEYNFEGCYGPYHHGKIQMELRSDTIYFVFTSFDDKGKRPLSEAGKYHRDQLISLLVATKGRESGEVLGNTINYRLTANREQQVEGVDKIEQRHFVDLFQPFSSIFKSNSAELIPKVSSGGFVH